MRALASLSVPLRLLLLACALLCAALPRQARALDQVTLQLKHLHQFQFAGYYAAQAKGYYKAAGLDVVLRESSDGNQPEREVLAGRAQYGVGSSSLLLARAAGKPVVVLAAVFQHSPYVLIAADNGPIKNVRDMAGRRVMIGSLADEPSQSDEFVAYLMHEGVPLNAITRLEHTYDPEDLINGRVDAISAYSTNEPDYFKRAGFAYRMFSPRDAGIDFYGDNLFTSEAEINAHPERVQAFREASLRGWEYAMTHQAEIADLIRAKYSARNSREHLLFEAEAMVPLVQPMLVEAGYMNPARWQQIAATYRKLGLLRDSFSFDGFLYKAPSAHIAWLYRLWVALAVVATLAAALYFHRMRAERKAAQRHIRESEERWNFALSAAGFAVCDWNLETGLVLLSKRWYEMHGYPDEGPVAYRKGLELIHPYDLPRVSAAITDFLEDRSPAYACEYRAACADGSYIWVLDNGVIVNRNNVGKPLRVICTHADITQRKQTEQALQVQSAELQQQAAFMNAVIENIPIAVFVKDVRQGFR
ncbi:MAG TPA: ABC transporter substrate-binding protein, partial [Burkholderiaceae bacterium]